MNYYIIKPASDNSETGSVYPQVQKMSPGYDYKATNSVHALSREVEDFPSYEPNLDYFVVKEKAKLSDLLSVAVVYGGLLISSRFKALLEQFHLPKHRFYPAKVNHKKQFHEYYWMHIISDFSDFIDYPDSTFIIYYNYSHTLGTIAISSREELEEKRKKVKEDNPGKTITIWAKELHLKNSFDRTLDLFNIANFDSNTYISHSLKETIHKEKITGCEITSAKNVFINQLGNYY